MKLMKLSIVTAGLGLAFACNNDGGGTDTPDTGDTFGETDIADTDDGDECGIEDDDDLSPIFEDNIDFSCTPGSSLSIQFRTINWGYDAQIYIAATRFGDGYDEEHDLTETDQGECVNDFSIFELNVTPNADGVTGANFEDGVRTTFRCENLDPSRSSTYSATYGVVVYDEDGAFSDCIVFGQDTNKVLDGTGTGISSPSWLTRANCRVVTLD